MRAEDAGARTWLYAGFAGWAACLWLLAMFGMGGSIDPLDDDPSLRQPLPALAARGPERLGPLAGYDAVASRPLFTDNRRPQTFLIDPGAQAEGGDRGFNYVLTSVLRTPQLQLVILQPAEGGEPLRVRLGAAPEAAPGWVLQSVDARSALFAGPEGEQRLELRVFDGVGGQVPTPLSVVQTPADTVAAPAQAATSVVDAGMPSPARANGGNGAPAAAGQGQGGSADAVDPAAQQAASEEQVEMIRRRIEERRARLRRTDPAQATQPANENP